MTWTLTAVDSEALHLAGLLDVKAEVLGTTASNVERSTDLVRLAGSEGRLTYADLTPAEQRYLRALVWRIARLSNASLTN